MSDYRTLDQQRHLYEQRLAFGVNRASNHAKVTGVINDVSYYEPPAEPEPEPPFNWAPLGWLAGCLASVAIAVYGIIFLHGLDADTVAGVWGWIASCCAYMSAYEGVKS